MTRHLSHLKVEAIYDDKPVEAVEVEIVVQDVEAVCDMFHLDEIPGVLDAVLRPLQASAANDTEFRPRTRKRVGKRPLRLNQQLYFWQTAHELGRVLFNRNDEGMSRSPWPTS